MKWIKTILIALSIAPPLLLCHVSAHAQIRAYVGDVSGGVSVIDFATNNVTRINLGGLILGAAFSKDGTRAYLTNGSDCSDEHQ